MAYTAWTVVFGEQPSAAKWNILGANDASFNDGTGIGTNAVQAASLDTDAIKLGTTVGTSNINIVTTSGNVALLSCAVTIPAGSRDVEIDAYLPNTVPGGAATSTYIIWDGTIGSGTQLQSSTHKYIDSADVKGIYVYGRIAAPSAGAKTINFSGDTSGANVQTNGSATAPMILTVKLI